MILNSDMLDDVTDLITLVKFRVNLLMGSGVPTTPIIPLSVDLAAVFL